MSKSVPELLSEIRASIEFNLESYGSLVFVDGTESAGIDLSTQTAESAGSSHAGKEITTVKESMTLHQESEAQASTSPTQASEENAAQEIVEEVNLFGEQVSGPESTADVEGSPYARIAALIPEDSPLRTIETLENAERYVAGTILIPLDETRTNPVFGVGNPRADLMVIGEAPGADEDRQGEPFVGRAGQLLTKILQAIGFEREDVYIANILKSRPPNNRDPLAAEVEAHIPILYKQIALIQPKILLCVGKTAGTSLLNRQTSLAKLRGTFHDYHGLPVLVTYHPAALLRNPHWKRPTWEDVQLLRTRYDELGGA
jgi:DNA polymerase